MKFEIIQAIGIVNTLLEQHPNRSDLKELIQIKKELEQVLHEEQSKLKCDFCTKPCGNSHCVTKENKNE